MSEYIEFKTISGNVVLVEIESHVPERRATAGFAEAGVSDAGQELTGDSTKIILARFDDIMDVVRCHVDNVLAKLNDMAEPPSQIQIEFGLTASAKIAGWGVEPSHKFKLTWSKP